MDCLKNISVFGLWHQGIVASVCLAKNHYVVGYDLDDELINDLENNKILAEEPGLKTLLIDCKKKKRLTFKKISSDISRSDFILISYDTPVNDNDKSDISIFFENIEILKKYINEKTILIITSQVPVGTTNKIRTIIEEYLDKEYHGVAYIPENLKLGEAIDRFENPNLPVIGTSNKETFQKVEKLFSNFCDKWHKTDILTAEMIKHALNSYLSMNITFINELSDICEKIGANGIELGKLLKLEPRIGKHAF